MSVHDTVQEIQRGFALDDQISLTDLKRDSEWLKNLEARGKLRVSSYHDPIAVVVSAQMWRGLERMAKVAARLEAVLDEMEEEEIERLWSDRIEQERRPAKEAAHRALELLRHREG